MSEHTIKRGATTIIDRGDTRVIYVETHNHDSRGAVVASTRLPLEAVRKAVGDWQAHVPADAPRNSHGMPTRAARVAAIRASLAAAEATQS